MSNFAYIQPKHGLAKETEVHRLVAKIVEKVGEIPNHHEHKHNLELLKLVCVMIEHAIDNKGKKYKIDKKDIVFQVWAKLWNTLNPSDVKSLEANIAFLWENGFIVKKSLWSVVKHSVCDWVSRKILN